nr:energy transducer TonB [uncultured Sphingomonas sp.]
MSYANRKQMSSNRTAAIIIVALIHIVLGYALVTGLAYNVIKQAAEDLKTFDVEDEPPPPEEPPPPPPEQPATPPPPQVAAPPPLVRTNLAPPPIAAVAPQPEPQITVKAEPPRPATKVCPDGTTVLAQLACAPVKSQAAKAKGNLLSLFSDDDYPQSALRNEEQGTTTVRLTIGPDGRVSGCDVTGSSGSSSLDATTCNVLRRRARFTPAKDSAGNATGDSVSQRVTWRLPAE